MDLEYRPDDENDEPESEPPVSSEEPPRSRDAGKPLLWIAVALAVAAVAVSLWLLGPDEEPGPPPEVTERPAAPAPESEAKLDLGAEVAEEAEPVRIPPLEESDDVVRQLVRGLTPHAEAGRWLATDRLIHRFVATVDNIAEGVDPRKHLPVQRLEEPFPTTERGGGVRMDPSGYRRFDTPAALFVSVDPQGAARVYTRLKPRIQEAYRELGYPDRDFDRSLVQAIRHLLATPVPDTPPLLKPRVRGWAYQDPYLEALSPPQKVLIRMGPDNAEAVKSHLRRIARELGVPREQLE